MILAVHQPQYLPWLGYFDKMDRADVFCYLDNVQYKKNEWQNRNRIKTAHGWQWLTVPVRYRFPQRINEVSVDPAGTWRRKHLQSIITNYRKAPYFDQYIGFFEGLLSRKWDRLSRLNIEFIEGIRALLGLNHVEIVRATEMVLRDDPTDRLIDICRKVGADTYLAGAGGAGYMDVDRFARNGIRVVSQLYEHPVYPQLFGPFESHLSIVDLLMNCGENSLQMIRSTHNEPEEKV